MKQIIWSSDALLDETAREYYQNFKREELDDDAYKVSDEEWSDEVYNELGDERQNLNKDVNGVIIAFGDLGLWNGRKQGYQILGDNIAGILQSTQYDAEWYGDGYDIRGRMSKKDGKKYENADAQTFTENGTMYVVLTDGKNYGGSAGGTVTNLSLIHISEPTRPY